MATSADGVSAINTVLENLIKQQKLLILSYSHDINSPVPSCPRHELEKKIRQLKDGIDCYENYLYNHQDLNTLCKKLFELRLDHYIKGILHITPHFEWTIIKRNITSWRRERAEADRREKEMQNILTEFHSDTTYDKALLEACWKAEEEYLK